MRLIDADALMEAMYHRAFETDGDTMWQSGCWVRYRAIEQVVKEQPSVESEPVRHGQWAEENGFIYCPFCGDPWGAPGCESMVKSFNYCPNCGARMDGET